MHAIILAAGRGSRMQQYTDHLPKCMLPLQGKPLIRHQIEAIHAAGINQIHLICGYLQEKILVDGITERIINQRWHETNMVQSLLCANSILEKYPTIVSYADIFYAPTAMTSLMETQADIAVLYDVNFKQLWSQRFTDPLADLETFKMNAKQQLIEIGKKPTTINEVEGQYMGVLKFTPAAWQQMKTVLASFSALQLDRLDMTSLLNHTILQGIAIQAVPYHDTWGEIDHASDLALYQQYQLNFHDQTNRQVG
jgi:L-glutamine-phosphate cytidylyltransferase